MHPPPSYEVVRLADTNAGFGYILFVPPNADTSTTPLPLLLSLHGAGESGDGNAPDAILTEGQSGMLPNIFADNTLPTGVREQIVLVAPRTKRGWNGQHLKSFVEKLIDEDLRSKKIAVDRNRLYVTGCSMGGAGTWSAGETGLFSAVLPVCASSRGPSLETIRSVFPKSGVWAFHAVNDCVVPVAATDEAVRNFETAGVAIRYSRYEKSPAPVGWSSYEGHASWIDAYQEPDLWEWILKQGFVGR